MNKRQRERERDRECLRCVPLGDLEGPQGPESQSYRASSRTHYGTDPHPKRIATVISLPSFLRIIRIFSFIFYSNTNLFFSYGEEGKKTICDIDNGWTCKLVLESETLSAFPSSKNFEEGLEPWAAQDTRV